MKAIIIEEARFAELVETLRLQREALPRSGNFLRKPDGMSDQQWDGIVQDVHHQFHCTFVRWAQSHGASCVR